MHDGHASYNACRSELENGPAQGLAGSTACLGLLGKRVPSKVGSISGAGDDCDYVDDNEGPLKTMWIERLLPLWYPSACSNQLTWSHFPGARFGSSMLWGRTRCGLLNLGTGCLPSQFAFPGKLVIQFLGLWVLVRISST